jgi:hypothetical protein
MCTNLTFLCAGVTVWSGLARAHNLNLATLKYIFTCIQYIESLGFCLDIWMTHLLKAATTTRHFCGTEQFNFHGPIFHQAAAWAPPRDDDAFASRGLARHFSFFKTLVCSNAFLHMLCSQQKWQYLISFSFKEWMTPGRSSIDCLQWMQQRQSYLVSCLSCHHMVSSLPWVAACTVMECMKRFGMYGKHGTNVAFCITSNASHDDDFFFSLYGCLRLACGWIVWHVRSVDDGRFRRSVCEALCFCYMVQALAVVRAQFTDRHTWWNWVAILPLLLLSMAYGSFRFRKGGNLIKIYELPTSANLQ